MSKAFDTVKRNNLMELLETVLDPDETHMIKIPLKDVKLSIRIVSQALPLPSGEMDHLLGPQ